MHYFVLKVAKSNYFSFLGSPTQKSHSHWTGFVWSQWKMIRTFVQVDFRCAVLKVLKKLAKAWCVLISSITRALQWWSTPVIDFLNTSKTKTNSYQDRGEQYKPTSLPTAVCRVQHEKTSLHLWQHWVGVGEFKHLVEENSVFICYIFSVLL